MRLNERSSSQVHCAQIPEYNLNIEPIECFAIMKNMGNTIRYPRKNNNTDPKRDTTKYCEFHGDHDHSTFDCMALSFEVADLPKKRTFPRLSL